MILSLQEPQRIHQRLASRDTALSNSSGEDSHSSVLCSNKDGGSSASSPHASSGLSSYTGASDRKDPSVLCYSPGLNGQQKLLRSPNHTPRPSLTSSTSHSAPKSRCSGVKYRKTSQPLRAKQSPNSQSVNKTVKELEAHKKSSKLVKRERKGKEKKRKKKEEKRLAEKKKKRDKTAKKEGKLVFKGEFTEKGTQVNAISSCHSSGEVKMSKAKSLFPEYHGLSPFRNKHRMKSEQEEQIHKLPTNTHSGCTTPQRSSKSRNPKMPKKYSGLPKPPFEEQIINSLANRKKPTIILSKSEDRLKAKPDDTLPSLLFKALAPLTTGCSVSLEQPNHGTEGRQGEVLDAPDLQPVAVLGHWQEMGDNLANTPPVLSWQGSPASAVGEDEELEKGVMSRPVLQPSPTQCFSPPPTEDVNFDDFNKEPNEGTLPNYSQSLSNLPPKQVADEKEDSHVEIPGSLLCDISYHNTDLDDVFNSLTTFVEGQRVLCRGGPFGGAPTGNSRGVKYSSSLALGPEIPCQEHLDLCSKSDPTVSAKPDNRLPLHTTSDSLLRSINATDLREPVTEVAVQEKQEQNKDMNVTLEQKDSEMLAERSESTLLDGSLRAELKLTTTHADAASLTKEDAGKTQHIGTEGKRKQKAMDGGSKEDTKIKMTAEGSKIANEINDLEERDIPSPVNVISGNTPRLLKDRMKGQIPKEKQTPHGKDIQTEKENTGITEGKKLKDKTENVGELKNVSSSATGNIKSTSLPSTATINTSNFCSSTPATKVPCSLTPADPLKIKALSMGLSKELKILLIKLESAGRQTFHMSEVEGQRIPLAKISIENTANEVVRACK